MNTEVGKDVQLQQLVDDYDAVFLGVGTYKNMRAGLDNEEAPGFMMRFTIPCFQYLQGHGTG